MKNKVIQKFFTILLGLMMVSPGWAATQYCDHAVSTADGDVTVSIYHVNGNSYGITIKAVGNLEFNGVNNCNCGVNQSAGAGITLANGMWTASATEASCTFSTASGESVPTGFFANYVCLYKTTTSGKTSRDLIEINLPTADVDWSATCSGGGDDDTEAPEMTSASLVSKTHNSAVIAVEATDNVGVTKYVVYNNTATQGEYAPSDGKITVTGLAQQTAYTFIIKAKDAAGNESENGKEVTFTTDAFVYYKYATGHLRNAEFGDPAGRILLTLTKMGTNAVDVLVEPKEQGTIIGWASAIVNGVSGTIGEKSASPSQNVGVISLKNVTLPATGTFAVNISWHTPALGDGAWTTNEFQVATAELYVAQGVAVTGVSIPETATVDVNGTQTLTATITPANASNQNVTWTVTSGSTYASVDANGVVTGKAVGSATVQVKTVDGDYTDECTVTVVEPRTTTWWGTGSFNEYTALYSVTRNVDKTLTYALELSAIPEGLNAQINVRGDGTYNNMTSAGGNSYTFTTTETFTDGTSLNGFFHLPYAAGGLGHIDVAYTVGSENVKPAIEVTGVSIDPPTAAVEVGKTTSLTAIIKPAFATNTNISWSVIAGTQYASIDANGVVTGLAAGAATVQVTTESGSKTATCDVNVVAQILLEPNAAPAAPTYPAEQVKAVYSATYSADCSFGDWGGGTAYTQDTYGKKYVNGPNGYFGMEFTSLNCSQMEKLHLDVWARTDLTFRVVPIHGGTEQGVTVNIIGQQWNSIDIALNQGDWANVTDWSNVYQIKIDQAANETFWLNNVYFYTTQTKTTCALSASVKGGEGGTASVDKAEIEPNQSATFTAVADCGYRFVQWLKNNTQVSTDAAYTTTITEDMTLEAEFVFEGPAEAATVPDYDLTVPIYTNGTPAAGVNALVYWGEWDHTLKSQVSVAGNTMVKYSKINFQGVDFNADRRNVSTMDALHMDIWSTTSGPLHFSLIWDGGESPVDVQLEGCQWNSIDIPLSEWSTADLTTIRQLKFDVQGGAVEGKTILVQDIFFYAPNEFTLSETESNETNLEAFNGKACDVTIARSFTAGSLYTLALPFDMDADQVEETFGTCTMYALAESYWKVEGENMYIRFAPVTEFKANTPILFTPTTNLANVVAKDVTINNAACATATDFVTFHGTYSKMALKAPNYILAADQYLYPVVGDEYSINGMRGYFSFGASVPQAPKMARIILHEEITTDNAFLRNGKQEMRAKKVLENGRFVIIRDGARYGVLGVEE